MTRLLALLAAAVLSLPALADSPLSSSELFRGYADLPLVARALARDPADPVPSAEVVAALTTGEGRFDEKLALLDALGFGHPEIPRALMAAFAHKRHVPLDDLAKKDLTAEDKATFGYALAMADIWTMKPLGVGNDLRMATPQKLLAEAKGARPADFSIAFAHALVVSQKQMATSFCAVWKTAKKVLVAFPADKRNLRPASVDAAVAYLALYRSDCPDERPSPAERDEVDQVNDLVLLNGNVLVATQGGAVLLDGASLERRAFLAEDMCFHALAYAGKGFVSCSKGLYVLEGTTFKKAWTLERRIEGGLDLMAGPGGKPMLKEGGLFTLWDGERFSKIRPPIAGYDPYDVVIRQDGTVWGIDFLKAIHAGDKTFALRSPEYPGTDPRNFIEDAHGGLWVLDFESGVFRWDAESERFFPETSLPDQASGLLFDGARLAGWLHYRRGLTLVEANGQARDVVFPGLDYLRGPLRLADGSLLVGGTPGVARVRPDGRVEKLSLKPPSAL